jgi:hypothetical protein
MRMEAIDQKETFLAGSALQFQERSVEGHYVQFEGEDYYAIEAYDHMKPFFMTIVSATDHWLFISSTGGLSAGRRNPENALFPYYTDDKISESSETTGSKTALRVSTQFGTKLWLPFNRSFDGIYRVERRMLKNRESNRIIFEERNLDLGLCFRYGWMFSEDYGIVKRSWIENFSEVPQNVELLDGFQNVLPFGVSTILQNNRSTLVEAYKRSEFDEEFGLAHFSLSAMIVDKAEPSEALKCSTVWSAGLEVKNTLLCSEQIPHFLRGGELQTEYDIKAQAGAFLIESELSLGAGEGRSWVTVGELEQSSVDIEALRLKLNSGADLYKEVLEDVARNKEDLRKKIGMADGIQLSRDRMSTGRHFSNVLFNIMRGGTFEDQYEIETADFIRHIQHMNREGYKEMATALNELPRSISYHQLRYFLQASKHHDAMRYYFEYLPISFSRRHGDPSRPWNYFSIDTKDEMGNRVRNYEGNWRDIFQNWEALAYSYPEFALGMISKFVNASTIDGYNPYRITRDGIDWEVIEPHDPWSFIGYWGDHQIVYLHKLLEVAFNYHPHRLLALLNQDIFTYANVPYRIKGYNAIATNPKSTIDFDPNLARIVDQRVEELGSDGKLVWDHQGELERANLTEKLLLTILTKLYNYIPEGGIWLNTQRPEWNDANNALVGNGVSMVTLYQLRDFLQFMQRLLQEFHHKSVQINKPIYDLLEALQREFNYQIPKMESGFNDRGRRHMMDALGVAGEHYRTTAYEGFTGEKRELNIQELRDFFTLAQAHLESTIKLNKREDGLYHSYNLVHLSPDKAELSHLYEMLEGQVAILECGILSAEESLEVLNALKSSKIFRPDQYSYMLYPDMELPRFMDKNRIDPKLVERSEFVSVMLSRGDRRILERDVKGQLHFNGSFRNSHDLEEALEEYKDTDLHLLADTDRDLLFHAFEETFNHKSFTGRSGTFYGYEGLGSIYWHMVSKLLVSTQESILRGQREGSSAGVIGNLIEHYYEIRAGIGVNKSPELYGAIPTDPYSHTPKYAGAQQPGMTGQVKEDIINRWAELGISSSKGQLSFRPRILRRFELLESPASLSYYNSEGVRQVLDVDAGCMAFTYCQIPVVYKHADEDKLTMYLEDGSQQEVPDFTLSVDDSKEVFKRTGKVVKIEVGVSQLID